MPDFIRCVEKTIETYNMIHENEHILLGLSGGADSVALLYVLMDLSGKYGLTISAVHVNHGIRGEFAKRDEDFVSKVCYENNIRLKIFRFDAVVYSKARGLTLEEAGRIKRYKVFCEVLNEFNADKIAVAHNLNDQAETVLMNMIRGTGQKGLTGIPPVRDKIIRPLIKSHRSQIEAYLFKKNASYIQDETNCMEVYTRNKIRMDVIPKLQQLNPNIVETLAKTAQILAEENNFIQCEAEEAYNNCILPGDNIALNTDILCSYHPALQKRVLRLAIQSAVGTVKDFSYIHANSLVELAYGGNGRKINLSNGFTAEKSYGKIILYKDTEKLSSYSYNIEYRCEEGSAAVFVKEINMYITVSKTKISEFKQLRNVSSAEFDYDKIVGGLFVRNRRDGDRIYINHIGTQKLKKFFIDNKIPRNDRNLIPLICDEQSIVWIVGKRASGHHEVTNDTIRRIIIQSWII